MKIIFPIAISLLLASGTLSMTRVPYSEILTKEDYQMQLQAFVAHKPEMTAFEGETPYWESFNQWLCFPAKNIEVGCEETDDDGDTTQIPLLRVIQDGHYYEISMDPDPKPDCERVKRQWRELMQDERELCAYAAPLQELKPVPAESGAKDGSLWIINCLKTGKGYWDVVTGENLSNGTHLGL